MGKNVANGVVIDSFREDNLLLDEVVEKNIETIKWNNVIATVGQFYVFKIKAASMLSIAIRSLSKTRQHNGNTASGGHYCIAKDSRGSRIHVPSSCTPTQQPPVQRVADLLSCLAEQTISPLG